MESTTNPVGRPTDYSKELADVICARLSEGESLRTVCTADDMPAKATVFRWLRTYPEFRDQYAHAKEESADAMAEDILEISDESLKIIVGGEDRADSARVQANKLRVDTRKWLMSKMKPKKYADKIDMTTNGKDLPTPIYGSVSTNPK